MAVGAADRSGRNEHRSRGYEIRHGRPVDAGPDRGRFSARVVYRSIGQGSGVAGALSRRNGGARLRWGITEAEGRAADIRVCGGSNSIPPASSARQRREVLLVGGGTESSGFRNARDRKT